MKWGAALGPSPEPLPAGVPARRLLSSSTSLQQTFGVKGSPFERQHLSAPCPRGQSRFDWTSCYGQSKAWTGKLQEGGCWASCSQADSACMPGWGGRWPGCPPTSHWFVLCVALKLRQRGRINNVSNFNPIWKQTLCSTSLFTFCQSSGSISCHPPHALLAGWRAAHSPRFWSQSIRGTSRLMAPAWFSEGQGGKSGEAPETGALGNILIVAGPEGSDINKQTGMCARCLAGTAARRDVSWQPGMSLEYSHFPLCPSPNLFGCPLSC